jgi:hypothetical protein
MGDWFQKVVDIDATEDEAPVLADSVLAWLVSREVVAAERSDSVFGAPFGYGPGPRYESAVTAPDEYLRTTLTNGVALTTRRTAFDPGQGEDLLRCSRCDRVDSWADPETGEPGAQWLAFQSALEAWYRGGPELGSCVHCGHEVALNDWRWEEMPWVFGALGLTFWNWPPLAPDFVADIGRHLGHRVRSTAGKL